MYPLISKYHNNPSIVNLHKVRLGYESLVRFVVRDGIEIFVAFMVFPKDERYE